MCDVEIAYGLTETGPTVAMTRPDDVSLIDGVSAVSLGTDGIYAVSAREGVSALSLQGNILWRQGLPQSGDLTQPVEIGPYLVFSGSREGLFIVARRAEGTRQVYHPFCQFRHQVAPIGQRAVGSDLYPGAAPLRCSHDLPDDRSFPGERRAADCRGGGSARAAPQAFRLPEICPETPAAEERPEPGGSNEKTSGCWD